MAAKDDNEEVAAQDKRPKVTANTRLNRTELEELRSSHSRMLRERPVSLPTHQPAPLSLSEALEERRRMPAMTSQREMILQALRRAGVDLRNTVTLRASHLTVESPEKRQSHDVLARLAAAQPPGACAVVRSRAEFRRSNLEKVAEVRRKRHAVCPRRAVAVGAVGRREGARGRSGTPATAQTCKLTVASDLCDVEAELWDRGQRRAQVATASVVGSVWVTSDGQSEAGSLRKLCSQTPSLDLFPSFDEGGHAGPESSVEGEEVNSSADSFPALTRLRREVDEVDDNAMFPEVAALVSGGGVSKESLADLEGLFKGRDGGMCGGGGNGQDSGDDLGEIPVLCSGRFDDTLSCEADIQCESHSSPEHGTTSLETTTAKWEQRNNDETREAGGGGATTLKPTPKPTLEPTLKQTLVDRYMRRAGPAALETGGHLAECRQPVRAASKFRVSEFVVEEAEQSGSDVTLGTDEDDVEGGSDSASEFISEAVVWSDGGVAEECGAAAPYDNDETGCHLRANQQEMLLKDDLELAAMRALHFPVGASFSARADSLPPDEFCPASSAASSHDDGNGNEPRTSLVLRTSTVEESASSLCESEDETQYSCAGLSRIRSRLSVVPGLAGGSGGWRGATHAVSGSGHGFASSVAVASPAPDEDAMLLLLPQFLHGKQHLLGLIRRDEVTAVAGGLAQARSSFLSGVGPRGRSLAAGELSSSYPNQSSSSVACVFVSSDSLQGSNSFQPPAECGDTSKLGTYYRQPNEEKQRLPSGSIFSLLSSSSADPGEL